MKEYKEERVNNTREYKLKTKLNTCKDLVEFSSKLSNFRNAIVDSITQQSIEILQAYIIIIYNDDTSTKSRSNRAMQIINNSLLTISVLLEILLKNQKIQEKQIREFERYYEILHITN